MTLVPELFVRRLNKPKGLPINVRDVSVTGDGQTDDYAALNEAVRSAGATGTLYFPAGTYVVGTNLTIPACCIFAFGAKLKPSSGVTVTLSGPVETAPGESVIASGTAGTVSITGSLESSGGVLDVRAFGAVGDGVTDDTAAIQRANTAAVALAGAVASNGFPAREVTLLYPSGSTFAISATLNLSGVVNHQMEGRITYTGSANEPAIVIGAVGLNAFSRRHLINVSRSTQSTWLSEANVGVRIINHFQSFIHVVRSQNFTIGLQMLGDDAGCAYNEVRLGYLVNNKVGVDVTCEGVAGYANENLFLGGRFSNDSSVNTTLDRFGIRITSNDQAYINNNNNVFLKPSLEMKNAGTGEAVGILVVHGTQNHFIEVRNEDNDDPILRVQNASSENTISVGYATSPSAVVVEEEGTAPNTTVLSARNRVQTQGLKTLFNSGPLHKTACFADGATSVNAPNVHFTGSGGSAALDSLGSITMNADYLDFASGRGCGIFLDTRTIKQFVVKREAETGRGGRVVIRCYDAAGTILTDADAGHPYAKSTLYRVLTWTSSWGGAYTTGVDSENDVLVTVGADVASVAVLCVAGTASLRLRSFAILAATGETTAATYLGYIPVADGQNQGTAAPTAGTWTRGRVVWNSAPSAGGFLGWVCTTAGTPGTWKTFGAISP